MTNDTNSDPFVLAKKEKTFLRAALIGVSGTGKTMTALQMATVIAEREGGKIAMMDTEGRSARRYADLYTFHVFDMYGNYNPAEYIRGINAAAKHGYSVLIIDSFTHAWNGSGGVLDIVDHAAAKMGDNKFGGWSKGRPAQNDLVNALLNAEIHIIGTMREKAEWVIEKNEKGVQVPRKIGVGAIQDKDFEFEFDIAIQMDMQHAMHVTKSRCKSLNDEGDTFNDTAFVAGVLHGWITDGVIPEKPKLTAIETYLNNAEGKNKLAILLNELSIADKDYAYYLERIEPERTLNRFGETILSEEQLHAQIKKLHAAWEAEQAQTPPATTKANGNGQPALTPEQEVKKTDLVAQGIIQEGMTPEQIISLVSGAMALDRAAGTKAPKSTTPPASEDIYGNLVSVFVAHDGKNPEITRPRLTFKFVAHNGAEYEVKEFGGSEYTERGYFPCGELDNVGDTIEYRIPCTIFRKGQYWNVRYDSLTTIVPDFTPAPEGSDAVDF